ncbi:oligopeptide transport system permease protein [Hathewaya proteolytica DSM 3090]|uniref:Oligopeptide transport system permease protein n=1 Tax=Hathewaya proteolytica DSM 3090 TaxID=1121331 RepID=A0A1M6QR25_9CLOT|nr:ABC transporter permease [Hathewaya proteolytica]SHK22656.1 oligopeptide transport system permease protein [Hathewaya proteolytica DSM 3090]
MSETTENKNLELTPDKFEIVGINSEESEAILRPSMTFMQDVWRRLKKNKMALIAGIVLLLIILFVIFAPFFTKPYDEQNRGSQFKNLAPTAEFWFGTDNMGRDMFSRIATGGRISVAMAAICTFLMVVVGCAYGGVAGYVGGIVDDIMMRIIEILSSIPYLIVVILMSMVLGQSVFSLVLAMSITSWMGTARMVRGKVMQLKEQEFVLAAQSLGASTGRIVLKHLLPNTFGLVLVDVTFSVPGFIFSESFLSYLGLGVPAPQTSWGSLASAAQSKYRTQPLQLFFPCLFISLVAFCFQLFGDGLNDALDPKLRQ